MPALWKIDELDAQLLVLPDMSSLDAVTRQLPAGFYSTFRTYARRTRVLGLRSHFQRLYGPSRMLGIQPVVDKQALRRHLTTLIGAFRAEEARIRLILTIEGPPGDVYVAMEPLQLPPPEAYFDGVSVVTTCIYRANPELKTTSFIQASLEERQKLQERSAYEALMVKNGLILEGLTSNFFYFRAGRVGTARRGILNGVTRRQVLRLAGGLGIPLIFRALPMELLPEIEEACLTSSSRGIVPIVQVDQVTVGSGRVGEGVRCLMKAYDADIETRAEKIS